jgi:hypothetical protein
VICVSGLLTLKMPSGNYMYHLLCPSNQQLCILPTECIYEFRIILTVNSDCFLKHDSLSGLVMERLSCGTSRIFK